MATQWERLKPFLLQSGNEIFGEFVAKSEFLLEYDGKIVCSIIVEEDPNEPIVFLVPCSNDDVDFLSLENCGKDIQVFVNTKC